MSGDRGSMGPDNDPVFEPIGFGEKSKGGRCPKCKGRRVLHIVYGMPSEEGIAAYRRGEIELGGCVVTPNDPVYHCQKCGHEWGGESTH